MVDGPPPQGQLEKPTLSTFGEAELLDLDDRTARVLRMRSGMWDGQFYKLSEVAEQLGVTGERVRQIQSQGLSLIRQFREAQRHLRRAPRARRHPPATRR
jgi:DNA-directed RNA polymerase sigma subunit (sigma70/sigma32)